MANGSVTQRDIYEAVDDLRQDVGRRFDRLTDRVDTIVESHEHRITKSEQMLSLHSEQIQTIHSRIDKASESRRSTAQWIVGLVVALGTIAAIVVPVVFIH